MVPGASEESTARPGASIPSIGRLQKGGRRMAAQNTGPTGESMEPAASVLLDALDPQRRIPGLPGALSGVPGGIASDILFLTMGYEAEEVQFVAEIAERQLSHQPDAGAVNGGILHHAAVVAPIVAAFGTGLPHSTVLRFTGEMRAWLSRYWKCGPGEYALSSANRLLFARGAAMAHLITEGETLPCWENDLHFIWMGSKFPDLRDSAREIIQKKRLGRDFLDHISLDWVPDDKIRPDGGIDEAFLEANIDRIEGRFGPNSILSDAEWEEIGDGSDGPELTIGPLGFTREAVATLSHFVGAVTDDLPFIRALAELCKDIDKSYDAGEAALLMMGFDRATIASIERAASLDDDSRGLILDLIDAESSVPDPDAAHLIPSLVRFACAAAPLLNELICVDQLTDEDVEEYAEETGIDLAQAENSVAVEESLDFMDRVRDCWLWFLAACSLEGYEVTEDNHDNLARGLTACHLIGCSTLEDAALETVVNIGRLAEKIVFHADELVVTGDLSRDGLDRLS